MCTMNLRKYYKIASKLSHKLKVQLVHAGVLSLIDYCNGVCGGLLEADYTNYRNCKTQQCILYLELN